MNQPAESPRGDDDLSFEQTLEQLKDVVEQLERGELPLEDSLKAFEHGVRLSRQGAAKLDAAERRVELLLSDREGVTTQPLDASDDNAAGDNAAGDNAAGDRAVGDRAVGDRAVGVDEENP